jgi:uncharacterized protein YutE (UPF0331/DUF86 family)
MTDPALVRKKLAAIETALVQLGTLGEPRASRELFDLLEHAGRIPADLATSLRQMTGFRNVLVHGYDDVDLSVVRDVLEHRLVDLERFIAIVRQTLGS